MATRQSYRYRDVDDFGDGGREDEALEGSDACAAAPANNDADL